MKRVAPFFTVALLTISSLPSSAVEIMNDNRLDAVALRAGNIITIDHPLYEDIEDETYSAVETFQTQVSRLSEKAASSRDAIIFSSEEAIRSMDKESHSMEIGEVIGNILNIHNQHKPIPHWVITVK